MSSANDSSTDGSVDRSPEPSWQTRRYLGVFIGVLWLLVFAAGILIDSGDIRAALGWKKETSQIERYAQELLDAQASGTASASGEKSAETAERTALLKKVVDWNKETDAPKKEVGQAVKDRHPAINFISAVFFFTPLNVAILAILAGFIGGCMGSQADVKSIERDIAEAKISGDKVRQDLLQRRMDYLLEHPFYSTIRSFIIYLIFISGLYVFSSDPFNPKSQSEGFTQYMRLAGLVSLLGFMVGYDPTKFQEWLALVPSPTRALKKEERGRTADDQRYAETAAETDAKVAKAKADLENAEAQARRAKAEAENLKAVAKMVKVEAEKAEVEVEKASVEVEKADVEVEKAVAKAEKAEPEASETELASETEPEVGKEGVVQPVMKTTSPFGNGKSSKLKPGR